MLTQHGEQDTKLVNYMIFARQSIHIVRLLPGTMSEVVPERTLLILCLVSWQDKRNRKIISDLYLR